MIEELTKNVTCEEALATTAVYSTESSTSSSPANPFGYGNSGRLNDSVTHEPL